MVVIARILGKKEERCPRMQRQTCVRCDQLQRDEIPEAPPKIHRPSAPAHRRPDTDTVDAIGGEDAHENVRMMNAIRDLLLAHFHGAIGVEVLKNKKITFFEEIHTCTIHIHVFDNKTL